VTEDDGTDRPYYSILVGGSVGEGRGKVGQRLGRFPEEQTPAAVAGVAKLYEERREPGETFPMFVDRVGLKELAAVAARGGGGLGGGRARPAGAPPGGGSAARRDRYYRGIITRVYYGSESGTLRSESTGREYAFRYPLVAILGAIPRIDGLREGMAVGFDL